ncbi:MATH domain and coiled-coil domain-containing protein At3g58270-like [Lycium ferocissimum]|uniref:MATH domain and coiled-coil domain-containing protein At3g58270-like n=1 Tax=Lycium ferocissimum TaxID=112874 RepID=UPI0028162265|nr:MATH domain and coiled-coil domain-containing protein At3g58270-like [Lycium ferocissimum]
MSVVPSKEGAENKDASPKRYLMKIESLSLLSDNGINKYESSEFVSGSYKWKMIIYPNGDGNGHDHISIYLAIVGTSFLDADWEVNATFSFLIFDQIHDNYSVVRGMERRFRNIKTEWGFSKCISHATFKDPCNGYLVNDECVFGVDVYVTRNHGVGECMSLLKDVKAYKHEWRISNFSKLKIEHLYSEEFTVTGYKWKILLYPTGIGEQKGKSISIFLESVDTEGFDCRKRVQAKYSISVKDQISGAHRKMTSSIRCFQAAGTSWGWNAFMPLSELRDPKKSFLFLDCCIVEADISVLGVVKGLT